MSEATAPTTQAAGSTGPLGKPRGILVAMLLFIVTFGFYGLYWTYKVYEEIKAHFGDGLGGVLGLVVYMVAGIVTPYELGQEIRKMYEKDGQQSPVSGMTGLWVFPGIFIIVGPIVWFVKIQGALNTYWRAKGAK